VGEAVSPDNKNQASRNKTQAGRNKIKARCNEIKAGRNKIQISNRVRYHYFSMCYEENDPFPSA
jgi:hypothetical protein